MYGWYKGCSQFCHSHPPLSGVICHIAAWACRSVNQNRAGVDPARDVLAVRLTMLPQCGDESRTDSPSAQSWMGPQNWAWGKSRKYPSQKAHGICQCKGAKIELHSSSDTPYLIFHLHLLSLDITKKLANNTISELRYAQ